MPPPLRSALRHYSLSALIAARAGREAAKVRTAGLGQVATVVATHQVAAAVTSQSAVEQMLLEQEIASEAEALINTLSFTTSTDILAGMLDSTLEQDFSRLVESLVQDAARAAESVSCAVRRDIWHVRYVSPPCCSRCAVLAGRVYRYSDGFQRHPNCDCVMVPTTIAAAHAQDPESLFREGKVTGLSKADAQAIRDGADMGQVVNVRRRGAGLSNAGRVLARRGRLTPEGIYARTNTREEAVALLSAQGYLL